MPKVIQILVADDHEAIRVLIRTLLSRKPEWKICAEAVDGQEAVEIAKKSCPDLAILDIQMPRLNGIEAAKEIIQDCPSTIILSDSFHDVSLFAERLQETGIKGFVYKPRMDRDLVPTVEAVLRGENCFPLSARGQSV
jgi:two-component system, NarL family, response regulator NreC